jgi:uncharacterized protein (DUF1501 family)
MSHKNCDCNLNIISRRSFLDRSFKTSLAVALSTLVDIPLVMKQALAQGGIGLNGKKVLFIWLRGANDGLNSVIPILDPSYTTARPTLAIPDDAGTNYSSTGLPDFPQGGSAGGVYTSYPFAIRSGNGFAALHPSLKFLAPGLGRPNGDAIISDLAAIHRVAYPRQSRSHFDSQRYWENGTPNNNLSNDGIFYRTIYESGLANTSPLTGVSIQGSLPLLLRGSEAAMTNLTDPLRYDLLGIPNNTNGNNKASAFLGQANLSPFPPKNQRGMLQLQYENLANTLDIFQNQIDFTDAGNTYRDNEITDGDQEWADANGGQGYYLFPSPAGTPGNLKNGGWRRPDGTNDADKYVIPPGQQSLFDRIKAAALILNNTDAIIAGTEYGGFDTHSVQGGVTGAHPDLNRAFGWAMYALRKYFTRYGRGGTDASPGARANWDDVVIVTLTEFGRTTIENADRGTDHAEAGVMFVAGGAVNGGVYNCSPSDPVPWVPGGSGSMFGVNGRYLRRATDYRQVLGEIIRDHLGATQTQLNRIIPGYANPAERLLGGGASTDGTTIRGELGIIA